MKSGPAELFPQHAALLAASAITSEVAAARGYRTVTKKSEMRALGFSETQARVPALLIPIYNVVGEVVLYQARPDVPRIKDTKALKYETPLNARMALDVPPGARPQIGNPAVPLFITEGVRKADAAVSRGLCCVALLGVWNWRGSNEDGGKVALPDWESVTLKERQVYIVFDSDVMLKAEVNAALSRLKAFLESRGAKVAPVYLPTTDGSKVGLDDYLAAGHNVTDLVALATPALRPIPEEEGVACKAVKGRAIELHDPEPADHPVDGAAVLEEIVAVLNRYIVLPHESAAVAITLWIVHTYLMDSWGVTPLLALSSPTKRCGKTTLLRIVEKLVRRALAASGVSAAAIYRIVEEHEPTLLIDEMDSMKENEDLRGVLNSGHTRDLAFIIRCVGEGANVEPRRFSTWCPKVLAHIGRLPGTLEDRAVQIQMRRKLPGECRDRIRRRDLEAHLAPLRRKLARWAQDVTVADPVMPDALDDRALDNWEPLISISDAVGGRWPELARAAALAISNDREDDEATENAGLLVLTDLRLLLDTGVLDGEQGVAGDAACEALRKMEERPWATWGRGRDGLLPVNLATLLRPFKVKSKQVRLDGKVVRRYPTEPLREAMARYRRSGSEKPATPATEPDPLQVTPIDSVPVAGVAGVAGRGEGSGCDQDRDRFYHHDGAAYMVGDQLPDGRLLKSIENGIPILVKQRVSR
jgi:hypothetical protein